jgi:hypothetical protein
MGAVRLEPGTTKNREGRLIVLPAELHPILREQWVKTRALERKEKRIIPWVFHWNGKAIRDFRTARQGAYHQVGQPGRLIDDFRRIVVRNTVRTSIPERVAMTVTTHKTHQCLTGATW